MSAAPAISEPERRVRLLHLNAEIARLRRARHLVADADDICLNCGSRIFDYGDDNGWVHVDGGRWCEPLAAVPMAGRVLVDPPIPAAAGGATPAPAPTKEQIAQMIRDGRPTMEVAEAMWPATPDPADRVWRCNGFGVQKCSPDGGFQHSSMLACGWVPSGEGTTPR